MFATLAQCFSQRRSYRSLRSQLSSRARLRWWTTHFGFSLASGSLSVSSSAAGPWTSKRIRSALFNTSFEQRTDVFEIGQNSLRIDICLPTEKLIAAQGEPVIKVL